MLGKKQYLCWIGVGLLLIAALWALNIELTYERNIRRGIPADFRIYRSHVAYNARA
jgi:hypothetical protein